MLARLPVTGPTHDEYQLIQRQLDDWEWPEKGGRPRKTLPADVARSVLADLVATRNLSAVSRKYHDVIPL